MSTLVPPSFLPPARWLTDAGDAARRLWSIAGACALFCCIARHRVAHCDARYTPCAAPCVGLCMRARTVQRVHRMPCACACRRQRTALRCCGSYEKRVLRGKEPPSFSHPLFGLTEYTASRTQTTHTNLRMSRALSRRRARAHARAWQGASASAQCRRVHDAHAPASPTRPNRTARTADRAVCAQRRAGSATRKG